MKTKLITMAALACAGLLLNGCMSGTAKRFFAENKGYTFKKCVFSLSTPWGTEVISADEISSTVAYPLVETNPVTIAQPAPTAQLAPRSTPSRTPLPRTGPPYATPKR